MYDEYIAPQNFSDQERKTVDYTDMRGVRGTSIIACALIVALTPGPAWSEVTADVFIEGLEVSAEDVERLESGDVIAFSGTDYENTDRELAADSMILVRADLAAVHAALVEETTVLPGKLIIDSAVIHDESDFNDIAFDAGDIDEVDKLLRLKPGKDYNFSEREYAWLTTELAAHRKSDERTRLSVASDAMRRILVERYQRYRSSGLEGVEGYKRSKRKTIDVGHELQLTTDAFKAFDDEFPEFVRTAVAYPEGAECCEHYFRWLKVKIAKRPTFALAHTVVQRTDEFVLLNERHFYVGHSLNSAQITLAWVPYGEDTYLGLGVSANADILDSTLGRMLRPVGRKKAEEMVSDTMIEIRSDLQSSAQKP
jgi:hypothetical protein